MKRFLAEPQLKRLFPPKPRTSSSSLKFPYLIHNINPITMAFRSRMALRRLPFSSPTARISNPAALRATSTAPLRVCQSSVRSYSRLSQASSNGLLSAASRFGKPSLGSPGYREKKAHKLAEKTNRLLELRHSTMSKPAHTVYPIFLNFLTYNSAANEYTLPAADKVVKVPQMAESISEGTLKQWQKSLRPPNHPSVM